MDPVFSIPPQYINNLPVEILLKIFRLADNKRTFHQVLRTVCKHWDKVILSDHRFWNSYDFNLSSDATRNALTIQKGFNWLQRAGDCVMDVRVTFTPDRSIPEIDTVGIVTVFTSLYSHLASLELEVPAKQLLSVLSLPPVRMDHLEELFFTIIDDGEILSDHHQNQAFADTPHLKKVIVWSDETVEIKSLMDFAHLNWQSLQRLELDNVVCIDPMFLNDLLAFCSNLEYLKVEAVVPTVEDRASAVLNRPLAICQKLQELHISFLGPDGANFVLPAVACPVLHTLSIIHPNASPLYETGEFGNVLLDFQARSQFPLRCLSLERIENFQETHLKTFLERVGGTLEELRIAICNWVDMHQFFEYLRVNQHTSAGPKSEPVLVPRLTSLTLVIVSDFPNPEASIWPMLSSRGWSDDECVDIKVAAINNFHFELGFERMEEYAIQALFSQAEKFGYRLYIKEQQSIRIRFRDTWNE